MKKTRLVQTILVNGNKINIVWLPAQPNVKVGTKLTLKGDPTTLWEVKHQYTTIMMSEPETVWNVGGLNEPRKNF